MSDHQRVVSGTCVKDLIDHFETRDAPAAISNSSDVTTLVDPNGRPETHVAVPDISSSDEAATPPSWVEPCEIHCTMRSRFSNLTADNPRVGMTPSMLFAYAQLRGLADKQTDPVYQALFPGASREMFLQQVEIPRINDLNSMQAFHKGAQFFYDPLTNVKLAPAEEVPQREPSDTTGQSYDEFMATFKPTVGRNHFKGAAVYSNFGYLNANGKWSDPDSVGSLNDAELLAENGAFTQQFSNNLPDLPQRHDGPKVMSEKELDEFYKSYVDDVTDECDGEGDPRDYRISPSLFARLAEGAARGDAFAENILDPRIYEPRRRGEHGRVTAALTYPDPQYDIYDGGLISGVRTEDSNPSLQESPRGVNLNLTPNQFDYLHPFAAHNIHLGAYTSATNRPVEFAQVAFAPSTTANPIIAAESIAVAEMGEEEFATATAELDIQRARLKTLREANVAMQKIRDEHRNQRDELKRDLFFLERDLVQKREMKAEAKAKAEAGEQGEEKEETVGVSENWGDTNPSASGQQPRLRKRGQIQRYLEEERQELAMGIWREDLAKKRLGGEVDLLDGEVENLKIARGRVCDLLENNGDANVWEDE